MSYDVCSALFVGTKGQTLRCYARGYPRYGGRCRGHADCVREADAAQPRCGYVTLRDVPCANFVSRPGERCGWHRHDQLLAQRAAQRRALQEQLEQLVARRRKLDACIRQVCDQLAGLGGGGTKAGSEAQP